MPIHSMISRLKEAYQKHFHLKAPEDVVISGLGPYDKVFKDSLQEESELALEKFRHDQPVETFHLHVKSTMHGEGKQLFELSGTLTMEDRHEIHAKTSNKDLLYAFKFLVRDLQAQAKRKMQYDKDQKKTGWKK